MRNYCGLDLECPPKAHVLKAWLPGWLCWEMMETLRSGTSKKSSGPCGCALKGDTGTPISSSFPLSLPSHEGVVLLCHILCMLCGHTTCLKQWCQLIGIESANTLSQTKPFLFKTWFSQIFVIVPEIWLTQKPSNRVWIVHYEVYPQEKGRSRVYFSWVKMCQSVWEMQVGRGGFVHACVRMCVEDGVKKQGQGRKLTWNLPCPVESVVCRYSLLNGWSEGEERAWFASSYGVSVLTVWFPTTNVMLLSSELRLVVFPTHR
jgi:hypothetical protein